MKNKLQQMEGIMEAVVRSKQITLPQNIVKKLKGRKVQIIETAEGILLKPVENSIKAARGFLKGSRFTTEKYFQMKDESKSKYLS
jgi:hypothetical protein